MSRQRGKIAWVLTLLAVAFAYALLIILGERGAPEPTSSPQGSDVASTTSHARTPEHEGDVIGYGSGLPQIARQDIERRISFSVKVRLVNQEGEPIRHGVAGVIAVVRGDESSRALFHSALQGAPAGDLARWEVAVGPDGSATLGILVNTKVFFVYGRAKGMGIALKEMEFSPDTSSCDVGDLILFEGGELQVSVSDELGVPLSDAAIAVTPIPPLNNNWPLFHYLTSDGNGIATFKHLAAGLYSVQIRRFGFTTSRVNQVDISSGRTQNIDITLRTGGSIHGVVLDADGQPAADVLVSLHDPIWGSPYDVSFGNIDREPPSTMTGKAGRFTLTGLEEGVGYSVRAERTPASWVVSKDVLAGEYLTLRLPGKRQVRGRLLLDGGEPATGAWLCFFPLEDGILVKRKKPTVAAADGTFSLDLLPGRYGLVAWHQYGEQVFPQEFVVDLDSNLGDLFLERGSSLELQVKSGDSGEPVPGIRLEEIIVPHGVVDWKEVVSEAPGGFMSAAFAELKAQDDRRMLKIGRPRAEELGVGKLFLPGIAVGWHRFVVHADGFAPKGFDVDIQDGKQAKVDIELVPSATLALRLIHPDGSPVVNLPVELFVLEDESEFRTPGAKSTGRDGKVIFAGLKAGSYGVREGVVMYGTQHGSELGTVQVVPGDNSSELTLKDKVQPVVVVVDEAGPVHGAKVEVFAGPALKLQVLLGGRRFVSTDYDGRALLPALRLGRYAVVVQRVGGLPSMFLMDLALDGQQLDVSLSGNRISGTVVGANGPCAVTLTEMPPVDERETWQTLASGLPQGILSRLIHVRKVKVECDKDGFFEFHDLDDGDYRLNVSARHFRQREGKELSLRGESMSGVQLEVEPAGLLTLVVDGLPRRYSAPLVAQVFDYNGTSQGSRITIFRNDEFTISDVPIGGSSLRITSLGAQGNSLIVEFPLYLAAGHPSRIEWDASP